jgi:ABC-type branched-subunit amino acid transport system substrate-binding protein
VTNQHGLPARIFPLLASLLVAACAGGPQVSSTQPVSAAADAPYGNILVVALFDSFDARRYLEQEIVKELAKRGVEATAMTASTDTRTIINRDTVVDRITRSGADAVLVTQLVSFEAQGKAKDANPEATYIFRPTYWYNVFEVDLEEYVEPQYVQWTNELALSSDLFSAASREKVWAMQSDWKFKKKLEPGMDYSVIVDEAKAIVRAAERNKLLDGQGS